MSGGWVDDRSNVSRRLTFPTLTAAIGYAERKGLDYRIERHRQHEGMRPRRSATGRLPRSWLARLARNEGSLPSLTSSPLFPGKTTNLGGPMGSDVGKHSDPGSPDFNGGKL